ncbi:MAG TPA: hypothetical protein PLS69_14935, partial [Terricaulis sp.]|nr:hypothetical protein [Terricaulis sp.]
MTAIRIVCAPDAESTAGNLARLLSAELYDVRVTCGSMQSADDLPGARAMQEIVLLIWSPNAHMARFPRDWREAIPRSRLVEIARTPGRLRGKDEAAPIDFINWRGERGGRAWGALKERLRQVA